VSELPVSGLFLGIGHEPNAKMFSGQIDLDEDGYIRTTGNVFTTLNGKVVEASTPAATCRTAATARPLPPPDRAAWRRSKPRSSSMSTATEPHFPGLSHC